MDATRKEEGRSPAIRPSRCLWGKFPALVVIAVGCVSEPRPPATPLPRSMKGWELYALHSGGVWSFALLEGTNRLKGPEEVHAAALELDMVLEELVRLPAGEQVFWRSLPPATVPAEPPPDIALRRIQAAIESRGVFITGKPAASGIP